MLNKKTYIRLFALIMALMMTVAVFAGCNNEAIDEANANAQAAQNAADEAKKAADSLAQAAKDLADQLAAAQDKINEQDQAIKDAQAEASKAQDAADKAQGDVDGFHDPANTTKAPETTASIAQDPWVDHTNTADLKAFTDLKNKYLVINRDWYTAENYAELNKIFEDAAFEIYRAVNSTGLEQIINDAATKAAQVDSIASDAAKVQALIAAFGDVPTEIFTTNDHLVEAAREAFDAWVVKYETCFFTKNGYQFVRDAKGNIVTTGLINGKIVERDIVDFAKKYTGNALDINVNTNTNSLLYAEAKVAALYQYAEDATYNEMIAQLMISGGMSANEAAAIVDVLFDETETQVNINAAIASYKTVLSIIDKYGVTYAECKANGKMIEDAYTVYRMFWAANGGDDTPISGAAGAELLTGEQFVKLYVLTLYNGELNLYENTVKDYLYNKVVAYFINKGNTSAIATETGWTNYLTGFDSYTMGYNADGSEKVASVADSYTFAVEFDRIDVYAYNATSQKYEVVDSIPADGVQIEKDFNRVAATAATKIFALDYDKDFKGNKSLDDAYVVIDQYIVEAITELTQVYYDDVIAYSINYKLNQLDDMLADEYNYTTGNPNDRADAYYCTYDRAFYANATKLVDLAKKSVSSYKTKTYAELNAIANASKNIENIADQQMFIVNKDAQGTLLKDGNGVSLYKDTNAAMQTVLAYFNSSMKEVYTDIWTRYEDLTDAIEFHECKIMIAEELDELVGIGTVGTDNKTVTYTYPKLVHTEDASITGATEGYLMHDYKDDVKTVLGNAYNDALVYNAISAARNPARDAIMAVEFMNYDEAKVLFTFTTYQAANAKGAALYYTNAALASAAIKTDAKDNKALNIIVDRDIVAVNSLLELYADGADSVLKAFADLVRANIQSNVTTAIDLYKKNYDFGGLDHADQGGVYLEKDMQEFIDYLNSLTNLAAIDAYSTTKFSLINNAVTVAALKDLAGYTVQTVGEAKNNNYLFHVTGFNADLDKITGVGTVTTTITDVKGDNASKKYTDDTLTAVYGAAASDNGWYDKMAKAQLDKYFALTSAVAYAGLEDVRELAYLKDNLINGTVDTTIDGITYQPMPVRLKSFTGTWDATANKWTVAPRAGFEYDLSANRTALYLQRLQETYNSICADIAAITILNVKTDLDKALDAAEDKIEAILVQSLDTTVDYNATDDKSLAIAYYRYYLIGQYDWVQYNTNINK